MAFADKSKTVSLSCGEKIVLPRLTIGKILSVTHTLSELAKTVKKNFPELMEDAKNWEENPGASGMKLLNALPEVLPVVADEAISLISMYIDKDSAWIKDNMDLEDLVQVAVPFFEAFMRQGNHVLGAFNQVFEQKAPAQVSDSKKETLSEQSPN